MFYLNTIMLDCADETITPAWEDQIQRAGMKLMRRSGETCREEETVARGGACEKEAVARGGACEKEAVARDGACEKEAVARGGACEKEAGARDGACEKEAVARDGACMDSAGVLWITEDEGRAKEFARRGWPVLGILKGVDDERTFYCVPYLCMNLTELEPEFLEGVYRRQARIPWDVLETERCLVRETDARDAGELYEIYADPSVTDYMEGLPEDPNAFKAWLEDYAKNVYGLLGYGIWTICLKGERPEEIEQQSGGARDGRIIGRAGLSVREGYEDLELGFLIGKPWQGQGLACEVCSAILDHARQLGAERVIAFARPGNEASVRLLSKLGFRKERVAEVDGEPCILFGRQL